jgi:pimeloyl-ACP methyl ester carboxylesterase
MKLSLSSLIALSCLIMTVTLSGIGCSTQREVRIETYGDHTTPTPDCVILLHGLARTSDSMLPLSDALRAQHYAVVNVDYPSRHFPIADLAEQAIPPALAQCRQTAAPKIHFVTHSLGGIVLRQYLQQHTIPELHRVVMLAPPNKGSQIVDKLKPIPVFGWINGPAGNELGTTAKSLPNTLGKVDFELGVIAGTTSVNLLLSLYLPNPDDGKVSLENTKIDGMRDFIALPVSHPYIMKDKDTIVQILHFLAQGYFLHTPESGQ